MTEYAYMSRDYVPLNVNYSAYALNETQQATRGITSYENGSYVKWCPANPSHEEDLSYKPFYEMAQLITGLIIYPLVCFPGVVGNALTIFVLSRRNMHTSTNAFLSALAVADSIKLLNDILYFFVIVFMRTSARLGNLSYGYLYPYAHFVFSLSVCVSSWLTVSVAVERYILVCHPTRARAMWSRKRAVILCTLIYVIMTSLALPSALRYRTIRCIDRQSNMSRLDVELTELWDNKRFVLVYTWAQNLLRSIIPLIILVVLNACIISALRRTKGKRRKNARHRVTIMMIVVILAFLICITPDAIMSTVFGFGYHEASYLAKGIREITDTLLAINAGVNFLIYCAFNQVFRKSFARICCPNRGQTTWMTELDESTYRRLSEAKSLLSSNNNSPPRREATPATTNDQSPCGNNGSVYSGEGGVSLVSGTVISDAEKSSPKYCGNGEIKSFQSSIVQSDPSSVGSQGHPHGHHHRASSNGLKKSKNSIKCNRAKTRANVTFCENVDVYRKGGKEDRAHYLNDLDDYDDEDDDFDSETLPPMLKDKEKRLNDLNKHDVSEKTSSSPKDIVSANTNANVKSDRKVPAIKSVTNHRTTPHVSSDIHNNFANGVPRNEDNKQIHVKDNNNDKLSDAEQLANFRNCDGTLIASCLKLSHDVNDSNCVMAKQKNTRDKVSKVCLKDTIRNGRKNKCSSGVKFSDTDTTVVDSKNLNKGDNECQSDRPLDKGDNQCEMNKKYLNKGDKSTKIVNGDIVNGNIPHSGSPLRSYLKGEVLTTDL